jgi:lysophospholipase L1-like esterase
VSRTIWRLTAAILGIVALLIAVEYALRFRYRKYTLPRARPAPGRVTLVALGDSIVAGWPYGLDLAWPALLAERLQAAFPDVQWRVINAGVPGETAPKGYARFDRDVAAAGPQLVLIAFGLNDCYPARNGIDRWLEGDVPSGVRRSFLVRAGAARAARFGRRLGLRPVRERTSQAATRTPEAAPRTSQSGFADALQALVDRAGVLGIRSALSTMTPLAQSDVEGVAVRAAIYPAYNEAIRLVAARNGLPVVELAAGEPPRAILPDGFHLTAAGQAWVAQQTFEQLAAVGVWRDVAGSDPP